MYLFSSLLIFFVVFRHFVKLKQRHAILVFDILFTINWTYVSIRMVKTKKPVEIRS